MPASMLPGVGVFGTGPLAKKIVTILKACGFQIAAVWSRALKDAEIFAKDMDIPDFTNSMDGLLLKPEVGCVVIICTPHLQSPIAVKAMGIGKHVIASWPAGTSQLEVLKMVKGATYYPSLLSMMCHGMRFLPTFTTMKQRIKSGYIGDLYLFEVRVHCQAYVDEYSWRCDNLMGGGALSLHGSYIVDIISYLSDQRAKSVSGMVKTYIKDMGGVQGVREITCDDFCTFQMELYNNVSVSCTVNTHVDGEFTHEIIAIGSKGRLTARDLNLYVKLNDGTEQILLGSNSKGPSRDSRTVAVKQSSDVCGDNASVERVRIPFTEGLEKALQGVAEAFRAVEAVHGWNKECIPERSTFDDALYAQTVIDSIRLSSKTKQWVSVNVLTEAPDPNPHLSSAIRQNALTSY